MTSPYNKHVGPEEFRQQLIEVTNGIRERAKKLRLPVAKISFLAASGMPGTEIIVPEFSGASYAGLSTYSKKVEGKKNYSDGDLVRLRRPPDGQNNGKKKPLDGELMVIFDNGSNRGELLQKIARLASDLGAVTITAAAMANTGGISPNVVGAPCDGPPREPYWKFKQLTPGIIALKEQLLGLDEHLRPNALIAVGDCFTAGTELAKAVGIDGRYVGGLCTRYNEPDTSWVEIGNCTDLRVAILGGGDTNLQSVAETVERKGGRPQLYSLDRLSATGGA